MRIVDRESGQVVQNALIPKAKSQLKPNSRISDTIIVKDDLK